MLSPNIHRLLTSATALIGFTAFASAQLHPQCIYYMVAREGDSCEGLAALGRISQAELVRINLGLTCPGNVKAGKEYCLEVDEEDVPTSSSTKFVTSTKPPSSTTKPPSSTTTRPPANGVSTPSPVLPNIPNNCNKFAQVQSATTCQRILDYYKITEANLIKWNPSLSPVCDDGLVLGYYACVGIQGGTTLPPTSTKPSNGVTTPTPNQEGMVSNCNKFAEVKSTTTCQGILDYNKITLANFIKWNPAVGANCANLWQGTFACVGVIGGTATTTSKPGNGVSTPTPTQSGMVSNCNKFAEVKSTTTCQGILDYNKITLANFFKWDPAVGKDCTGLWQGTFACVGVIGGTQTTSVTTPLPTQTGMVKGCTKFANIKSTTTCKGVLDYNSITLA